MESIHRAAALLLLGLVGCSTVKFVQKNPYTGEIWTVYDHQLGSDTITYCPPYTETGCREAVMVDGPPPAEPPVAYPPAFPAVAPR